MNDIMTDRLTKGIEEKNHYQMKNPELIDWLKAGKRWPAEQ